MKNHDKFVMPVLLAVMACSAEPGTGSSDFESVSQALHTSSDVRFNFVKTADWGSGYNARIDLTNLGPDTIPGWEARFDMPANVKVNVSSLPQANWTVLFTPGIENLVTISVPSDVIPAGQTRSIYLYGDYEGSFGFPLRCRFPHVDDTPIPCDGSNDTTPPTFDATVGFLRAGVNTAFFWGPATDDTGVTGYFINFTFDNPAPPPLQEIGEIPSTFASVSRLVSGSRYSFRVSARDRAGNESSMITAPVAVIPPPPLTVSFTTVNQWAGGGFQGDFAVTNTGSVPVDEWRFSFTFTGTFQSIWNAVGGTIGPNFSFVAPPYNLRLDPGETAHVGVTGTFGTPATPPADFAVGMGFGGTRPLALPLPSPCASVQCPTPTHCELGSSGFPTCVF